MAQIRAVPQPRRGRPVVTQSRIQTQIPINYPELTPRPRAPFYPRHPLILSSDAVTPWVSSRPLPVVVRDFRVRGILPRLVNASPQGRLPTLAVALPRPRPAIVPPLRRRPALWPKPMIVTPLNTNQSNPAGDLVAAAIAYLRSSSLPSFGDSPTTPKYFTDLQPPGTAVPYIAFDSPDEERTYESDGTWLAEGTLTVEIACGNTTPGGAKTSARLLAEAVSAILQDAPLFFTEGDLIYFRRSERKYRAIKETGPGSNIVIYKRPIEFKYFYEQRQQ